MKLLLKKKRNRKKTAAKGERRRSPAAPESKNIHKQLRSETLLALQRA